MEIKYIILGWLLGILSPGITNYISNKYKKNALKQVIISELRDIKIRLAPLPFRIRTDYGTVDIKTFQWTKAQTQNFKDLGADGNIYDHLEKLCGDDIKLAEILSAYNQRSKKNKPAFSFKKISTSTIDSNSMNFDILDNKLLTRLLEIKFHINAFNEEIQSVREYLKWTFDSNISNDNHRIISEEIERKNLIISEKAIYIVEKINHIIC
ncbi:MAG: hypothetical protein ACD_7C00497G0003 [uncultured bacterium]|nr:MAG: hypothetical protein ACD_7C00497G0003 [uncultured bacterium]KKP69004.1 MAG: hypothetical protein UR66_C0002G0061 [Candidatus Moranbacteria bacterium GW2011_GWE1_35_17]KKP84448.1 MAG: hypothetical protein UR82_C0006G0014 [Candidatus Moranbacteria bacterium GW2011_GWF1_35_5]HBR79114.1 hypothetical protein [Candidatus Moranbacteria bacterium]